MARKTYRLGTRKSDLAMVQSRQIQSVISSHGVLCDLVPVESEGDQNLTSPLYEIETDTPGLFTKHLERALLQQTIDLAVHSLKDLPTDQPKGLYVAAVPQRVSPGDCLVVSTEWHEPSAVLGLKNGAVVGTSSLRREAILVSERRDLKIVPIRGNVPTRVRWVREGKVNGVILAQAGIERLGLDLTGLKQVMLSPDIFVSAPGQGALAVETREDLKAELSEIFFKLDDPASNQETRIERKILKGLHGGCTLPLGVRCTKDLSSGMMKVKAFLGLMRDKNQPKHEWLSFHRFDISGLEEQTLVDQTVAFFKDVMP